MAIASVASDTATEVFTPASEEEAIAAFGDGTDVVVVGGGTIVVPDLTYRKLQPGKALLLGRAGLSGVTNDGSRVTIGATTPVQDLVDLPAPLGPCAANVADLEIRSQGTVGGNVCAGEGYEAPRGDLQGAFIAVGATARSAADGEVTEEPLEDFSRSVAAASSSASATSRPRRERTPASTAPTRTTTRRSRSRARAPRTGRSGSRPRVPALTASGSPRPRAATPRPR